MPKDSPQLAGALAQYSLALLQLKAYADAEPLLRECLTIREKQEPDAWTTFNTKSMLGGALLGQKKYADAEPLLLEGYEGMKERADEDPEGRARSASPKPWNGWCSSTRRWTRRTRRRSGGGSWRRRRRDRTR